jgi:predicted dienelactone hydrolase
MIISMNRKIFVAFGLAALTGCANGDPIEAEHVQVCDGVWTDSDRAREIPVRIRMPMSGTALPVVVYSHGLGGSVDAGTSWSEVWAEEGIATVHIQHAGSDTAVLRSGRLRQAASGDQLIARIGDVQFALDQVEAGVSIADCDLGRAAADRAGVAGHSFGAHTTLAIAGQSFAGRMAGNDPRFRAAIALSPAPPERAGPEAVAAAFGSITVPTMTITGTQDTVPINTVTAEDRILPYRALPPGDKYLLVFDGANHAAFSGNWRRRASAAPDPRIVRSVQQVTGLFWRAYLTDDAAARSQLAVFEAGLSDDDRFEAK